MSEVELSVDGDEEEEIVLDVEISKAGGAVLGVSNAGPSKVVNPLSSATSVEVCASEVCVVLEVTVGIDVWSTLMSCLLDKELFFVLEAAIAVGFM